MEATVFRRAQESVSTHGRIISSKDPMESNIWMIKKLTILSLHRAIGHDAKRHEDPERFWPERYSHDKTTVR